MKKELRFPLLQIDQSSRNFSFSLGPARARREEQALAGSEATLRRLRVRLAEIEPPAAARTVRRQLLRLVDLEVTTAHELRGSTLYLSAARRALAPLPRADASFRRRFAAARGPAAQAAALDAYAAEVARSIRAFRQVRPSQLLRPSFDAQLRAVVRVHGLAVRLAAALRRNDRAAVSRLVPQFSAGSAGDDGAAQARAIRRYNARVRAIARATAAIDPERARLQRALR